MTRKSTRWSSMLVWVFALAMPLSAFAQDPVALDFPAQSLAESLGMLGKQTETNILIDPKLVGDLQAPALKGILTADQALTKLLAGTSLRHRNAGATTSLLDSSITKFGGELTSQEFRLSSTLTGPWRWSAGAIYRDEKDSQYFDLLNNAAFPVTLQGIDSNIFTSKSFAVFGELTRTFFDNKLELTGGLRYFEDDASSNELTTIDLTASAPFGLRKDSFDAVTPRVVLTYKPGSSANYYASYSQGFRSGFSQNGVAQRVTAGAAPGVRPDRLSNYEIGTKGRALDGLLNYELAAYYIDWKDTIQVLTTIIAGATVNAALNSSGVAGPGVDAAATLKLFDRLDLSATLSWNDLGFVDDVISRPGGVVTVIYPKDSRPPQSSKTTAGLGIDYTMPLPGEYAGRFSGGVTYLSKMLTAAFTTSAALAGDDLTIVRASYTLEAPAGWSAMLFVDNLADENGRISPVSPANSGAVSDRLRPRTYGLQLDYRFH